MADSNKRVSNRTLKRKSDNEIKKTSPKKVRSCTKAGCFEVEPSCSLLSSDTCTESGHTSRWYHMSLGEHFCNNCFDNIYRSGRQGNLHYNNWSNKWVRVARITKPTIKRYVADELLPYWVQCTNAGCEKWRMVRKPGVLDSEFIKTFNCSLSVDVKSCYALEDKLVSLVSNEYFADQLAEPPLLKNSPAGPYLKRFLPEDIGLSPLDCTTPTLQEIDDIEPFSLKQCGEASIWPRPDYLTDYERFFISNTLISPATYLGMRNLIVTLWNLSPKEWLSMKTINIHLICRGLVRIYLFKLSGLILKLLTEKSVINYGIIENPFLMPANTEQEVLIIGAGISGLAAGRHLQNLGVNVTIFEANEDIGGRLMGNPLASEAYLIHGLLNNPFKILSIQANQECQKLKGKTLIFNSKGEPIPEEIEKRTQRQFRGIAQGALEQAYLSNEDSNWHDVITSNFKKFTKMSSFTSDFELFCHLLGLFEIELCGDLRSLSLLNWESVMAVKGDDAFLLGGIKNILDKLSQNLNIAYNTKVNSIDYSGEKVKVTTSDREVFFSKVLITVPLPILRDGEISFSPALPNFKQTAIESLGDYCCAKLILQFPKRFWVSSNKELLMEFSILSSEQIFQLFLDITVDQKNSTPTLVAILSPKALEKLEGKTNADIVEMCMSLLKNTFLKKKSIPSPTKWFITDWEKSTSSSYGSFLKVGSKKTAFDDMATTVDHKLFFAGEATFRNIPGNMTGAYLSGLREAANILESF